LKYFSDFKSVLNLKISEENPIFQASIWEILNYKLQITNKQDWVSSTALPAKKSWLPGFPEKVARCFQ
jgi:hypothetical protein